MMAVGTMAKFVVSLGYMKAKIGENLDMRFKHL